MSPEVIFRGANSNEGFTSPERNPTSPYRLLLCICKENPLALTLQQRRVSMGIPPEVIFRGQNLNKGFTSPEQNSTSSYHLLLCICKENPLAFTISTSLVLPG